VTTKTRLTFPGRFRVNKLGQLLSKKDSVGKNGKTARRGKMGQQTCNRGEDRGQRLLGKRGIEKPCDQEGQRNRKGKRSPVMILERWKGEYGKNMGGWRRLRNIPLNINVRAPCRKGDYHIIVKGNKNCLPRKKTDVNEAGNRENCQE